MKKLLSTLIILLSMLLATTGNAFAAPLKDGYLTLVEVRNDTYGGVIFVFNIVGELSAKELKNGVVFFGDEKYGLYCKVENSVLTCTTAQATAGHNVTVNIGGFIFWTFVPERGDGDKPSQYCYGVYDVYYNEDAQENFWQQFATHCQDTPANYGDMLTNFENPDFGFPSDYEFMPNDSGCFEPVNVDAYYGVCPS